MTVDQQLKIQLIHLKQRHSAWLRSQNQEHSCSGVAYQHWNCCRHHRKLKREHEALKKEAARLIPQNSILEDAPEVFISPMGKKYGMLKPQSFSEAWWAYVKRITGVDFNAT